MPRRMAAVLVGFLMIVVGFGQNQSSVRADQCSGVRESFAELKSAFCVGDGETAAAQVTPAALALYESCRSLALDSSDTDFEQLTQVEVLLIFQLRWLLSRAVLESMDGTSVFVWGIEEGLFDRDTLSPFELDRVQCEGAIAIATLLDQGEPVTDAVFYFELHDGVWKLDFRRLLDASESAFAAIRQQTGTTRMELAIYFMEREYGQRIPPQILNGPLR
jgi:hypothetical protein